MAKKSLFVFSATLFSAVHGVSAWAQDASDLNTEYFEIGVAGGIINIEDFGSEFIFGVNATFKATEDFFLQFNYMQASTSESSFELSQGSLFNGSDRQFRHYDFLLGYNLFQGETFSGESENINASLSSLYIVAGVGETEFGGGG